MNQQIVTIYEFKLTKEATEKGFLEASQKLDSHLLSMEGFLYRSITKRDDEWVDIVYWESREAEEKAGSLMELADFATFMALIDQDSIVMKTTTLYSSVCKEMEAA